MVRHALLAKAVSWFGIFLMLAMSFGFSGHAGTSHSVEVCTADGTKMVAIAEYLSEGPSSALPSSANDQAHCPLCSIGGVPLPTVALAGRSPLALDPPADAEEPVCCSLTAVRPPPSRAPPAFLA